MNVSPAGRVTPTRRSLSRMGYFWILYFAAVLLGVMGFVHWMLR